MADIGATRGLSDAVVQMSAHIEIAWVGDDELREDVYRLRHACYLREGAIDGRSDGRLTDVFDEAENTLLFAFRHQYRTIGSIRVQLLSNSHDRSPSALAFPEIVSPLLKAGKTLLDPTRFVIDATASRMFPALAYLALRIPFMAANHYGIDVALAAVRLEHMPFYRRFLRYQKVGDARPYLMLTKPLGLMSAEYARERPKVLERYPFMATHPEEPARLFPAMAFNDHKQPDHAS